MPERFEILIGKHEDAITRAWADMIYADPRTGLSTVLSYEQLVDPLPDLLAELALALDRSAGEMELAEIARRLRAYAQVRFYQGVLIDEVARELMTFRQVFEDFLWRESFAVTSAEDLRRMRGALRRANRFVDELLVQAVLIYAASLRPPVETRGSVWPPALRRRRTDWPRSDGDGDR